MEKTAGIEPDICYIEGGKLYLNYNKNERNDWFSIMEADIVSAYKNYPEITDVSKFQSN